MSAILEIRDLNAFYGNIHALRGVSLHVDEGEIVSLIGSNGAGKSTTLLSVTGLLKPAQGSQISFEGQDITGHVPTDVVKRGITLSPEGREIFPSLTVETNLEIGAYTRKSKQEIKQNFERVYELFPRLVERKQQYAGTLSGGEQQMLTIGRALMSSPKLLMLDEPSLGLAPNIVNMIFGLIQDINKQGITILLVEQNANMALKIADRGYVLETGTIKLHGDAKDLRDNDEVRKAYLGGK